MSSGALFIITILTDDEEILRKIPLDHRAKAPLITPSKSIKSINRLEEKTIIPISKSIDANHGTIEETVRSAFTNGNDGNSIRSGTNTIEIEIDNSDKTVDSEDTSEEQPLKKISAGSDKLGKNDIEGNLWKGKSWETLKGIIGSRRNSKKKRESIFDLDISTQSSMEEVLKELLKKFKIDNATWTKSDDKKSHQIIFTMSYDERYEQLVLKLNEWGIGERNGSTLSILNCATYNSFKKDFECDDEKDNFEDLNAQKQSAWKSFMNSMTARLNVDQIVRDVRQDATISFDFVVLVISAAILASFGLVENSTVFLASSMLVSPLMGPIIAAIFGTVIKENSLRILGIRNFFFGLLLATCVGFSFGLIVCVVDRYGMGEEGLTYEMMARCEISSIIIGILVALPSGAAAAVGVLGGNVGSLVGVAISASLLPPAVNSGIVWSFSMVYLVFQSDESRYNTMSKTNYYSDHQSAELAVLGLISMTISITNVICVYIMGLFVLKVKEIAPISRNSTQFWKHDIKIVRDYNKHCHHSTSDDFSGGMHGQKGFNFLKLPLLEKTTYQNTWSPSARHQIDNNTTIEDLEKIYFTVTRPYNDSFILNRSSTNTSWLNNRKVFADDLFSKKSRRASMPFDVRSPKQFRTGNVRLEPLERITESTTTMPTIIKTTFPKRVRKFIVTPVHSSSSPPTNPEDRNNN